METLSDPYVNTANGIEVPVAFRKPSSVLKLINHNSKLILRDDEDNQITIFDKELHRLKGLCYQGKFVLAGKNENNKWEIITQEKIDKPVEKWTLVMNKEKFIQLVFQDPDQLLQSLKRPRGKCLEDDTCSMCLDQLTSETEDRVVTDCNHHFHRKCLTTWVYQNTCPNCRTPLIRKKVKQE